MGRLDAFCNSRFDLAVVGGGIIGTGIARDAAMRGLRVALVEMEDFGHGTSSRSSRLIHGGLRYLAMLDFKLVRQDLRERELLLRIAPHLVRPLPFLIPVYRGARSGNRLKLQTGMALYDLLSYGKSVPSHRWLSAKEVISREPSLSPVGLEGAFHYYDAQVPSVERLCLENALSAQEHGARLANHARVRSLLQKDGMVAGLEVADALNEDTVQIEARLVINATGPWLDETLSMASCNGRPLLRRTKGIHMVTPRATQHALTLFAPDGRLFFVLPWNGQSLVGTTDSDFEGDPESVQAVPEDVEYLTAGVEPALPDGPWDNVHYCMAGVRALVRVDRVRESAVPRGHVVVEHGKRDRIPGLLSVVGGKITAYRAIAREVVDLICSRLGEGRSSSPTQHAPLPGARFSTLAECLALVSATGARLGLEEDQCRNLVSIYGSRASEVLAMAGADPRLAERICANAPDIRAQVRHAVEKEMACTVADFLLRRSLIGLSPCRGIDCAGSLAEEMGRALGWTGSRRTAEVAAYFRQIDSSMSPGSGKERSTWVNSTS